MKYIVKTPFIDLQHDSVTRQIGDVIEVTKKRHKEITDALGSDALVSFKEDDVVTEEGTVKEDE